MASTEPSTDRASLSAEVLPRLAAMSGENKNQGSAASGSSRDAQDPRVPATKCTLSREDLVGDGFKLSDFCFMCKDYGKKEVRVAAHSTTKGGGNGGEATDSVTDITKKFQNMKTELDQKLTQKFKQKFKQYDNAILRGSVNNGSKGSETQAEFYEGLIRNHQVENLTFQRFMNLVLPNIKIPDTTKCTAFDGSAVVTVGDKKNVSLDKDYPSEAAYQQYVMEQLRLIEQFAGWPKGHLLQDTSKDRYLDGRKPDVSIFAEGIVSSLYTVIVGEVKRKKDFSSSAKGELATFLEKVLHVQPTRQKALGFLTDGLQIMFMLLHQRTSGFPQKVHVTPILDLRSGDMHSNAVGKRMLMKLLQTSANDVGFVSVGGVPEGYRLLQFVGSGATSTVYSAVDSKEAPCAIKISSLEQYAQDEVKTLRLLEATAAKAHVPALIFSSGNAIVMEELSPLGRAEREPRASNFQQLLAVLRIAHEKLKLCHRDVRVSNWMIGDNDETKLIDWSFACRADTRLPYQGTLGYGSQSVLQAFLENPHDVAVTPADDLESVVRIAYYFVTGERVVRGSEDSSMTFAQNSLTFWSDVLQHSSTWTRYATAARQKDYTLGGMAELFPHDADAI